MASDSESEDEDSQNPLNVRFNEQEITELLTCLGKMINIILPFFKKNTKKERKITKKTKKAKEKVDASNEIRKLCSTIKAVVLSEVSAARSLEVVTETAKIHTPAAVGTSRSLTEAIPGTSRTSTEAIPGTSRSPIEGVQGTSRSHTGAVAATSRNQIEAITGFSRHAEPIALTSRGYTETISVTSKSQTEATAATSKGITEAAVTEISKNYTKIVPETSTNHTEAIPGTSKSHAAPAVTKKTNIQTTAALATPRSDTDAVAESSRSHTGAVPEATRSNTEAIPGTSRSHVEPAATKKTNSQTTAVGTTPRSDTDAVAGLSISHTGAGPRATRSNTEAIPETSRDDTEPAVMKKTDTQTPAVLATPRSDTDEVAGTSRSYTGSVSVTKKSNNQTTATLAMPRSDTDAVAESSRSHTGAGPGATRSNTEANPDISRDDTESAVIKKTDSKTPAVLATPRSDTDAVAGTSKSHTSLVTVTHKSNSPTTATLATPRSDTDAVAESSRSHTVAVRGATRSNTDAIPGTSRSHIEPAAAKKLNSQTTGVGTTPRSVTDAVAVTSKSDTVPGTTRSNMETIPGTSTSHTQPAVSKKTNSQTIAVVTTPRSDTNAVAGTSRTYKSDTGVVPGTARSNRETIPGTSTSHKEARVTEKLHRNQTKEVPETTISHTVPIVTTTSNRNHTKEVHGTTTSHTEARVTETLHRNKTKEVPGTTISHTVPTVTKTSNRNQTIEDPGTTVSLTEAANAASVTTKTSKNETKKVQFINSKQKNFTNSVSITPNSHTKLEAAAASKSHTKLQNPETSQTLDPTNTSVLSKPIVAEIPRGQTETVSQTPRNTTETVETRISSSPTEPMGTGTKKSRTQSVPGISHTDPVITPRHSCNTRTEAAAGTSKINTVAVAATSRSRTEATAGNSRRHTDTTGGTSGSHTESIPATPPRTHTGPTSETSRSHKETIAGNSRTVEASFTKSHTKNKNSEVSVRRIEALDPGSLAGTAKGHTKSIVRRNSSIHNEPVPGTSRNNPKAGSSSRSAPGTVVPETTRNLITGMLGDPKCNSERKISGIPGSPAATGASEIIRNQIEPVVPGTSKKPTEVKLSPNSKNLKNVAVSGTLKGDRQITMNLNVNIRDDIRQKASTNLQARNETKLKTSQSDEVNANISAKIRNDETNLKRNHANSNHDDPKRPRLDNKCSCKKSIFNDEQHCKHHKIKHNKENYEHKIADLNKRQDHMKTHEGQNGRVAKDTKSADAKKRTATRSESTPNGYIEQASFNSPRTKTTESEIAQKQANTKKITAARSESTLNGHMEQAISTSPWTKTTDSEIAKKQAYVKKRKSSRSEFTPGEHIEQATSNSALTKITSCEIAQKQANAKKRTAVEQANLTIAKNVNSERKIKSKTEEFTPSKIAEAEKAKKTGDDKRKRPQNETNIPETTRKRQIEPAVTNSKLAKKPRTDKDIKSVEANERKTTGKDTGPNADIGRESPNSTLAKIARNKKEKKTADAKKKTATKSDSVLYESTEETIASSTLKKRDSTKADYGHEAKFYPSIDLTSDNDDDKRKPPTTAVNVATSKSVKDGKKIKNEPIIDISEDTCFSDVTEESNEISNAIIEPSPKPADHDQVLIDEPVIDIDEDTCLYDPAEEKASVTIKKSVPKSTYDEQILQEEPVVDLTDDLDDVSEQKTSVIIKESSSNTAGDDTDDVKLNHEQGINNEVAGASTTNLTESNKTINKYRTKLLEELETKRAEDLLAGNVKKENANKNQLDSDTAVLSSIFHPSSSNQNTNQGIITTEQPAEITQRQDNSKKLNDIIAPKSKKPNEKPKNNANQPNPNLVLPYVTISTKAPDVSVSTTSTSAVQPTQKANRNNSAETRNSKLAPVITPELNISVRSAPITQGSPNLSITSSAYPALIQQSIPQTPRPDVSITTSTATSESRTPVIESRPEKPNPVTKASKRPDLEPSPRVTKLRDQKTNPFGNNAQISPPVSSEWVPSITIVSQPRHSSGNTESSTNHSNDVTCEPIKPKPVSTSQETPSPHVGSTAKVDLNSNRRENESSPVQTSQTHWRRPVPLEIPTSMQGTSRWQNSNLRSEALSNRNLTQLNDSQPPRPTWHTPVPAENERPDLGQVTLGVHRSPNLTSDQPNIPPHSLLNPVQPANERIPTVQAFAPSNPPLRPVLLIPRHQSTMIDYQRAPMATRPTWHIPTQPTDF